MCKLIECVVTNERKNKFSDLINWDDDKQVWFDEFLSKYPLIDGYTRTGKAVDERNMNIFLKEKEMIFQYVNCDLLKAFQNSDFDAIVHGCNCFHIMGAGIAGAIADQLPLAYEVDKKTDFGDWSKLGTYSKAEYTCGDIINAYTQFRPGKCPKPQLYDNIKKIFELLNVEYKGKLIGIPKIGAGIAGGNWDEIATIIQKATPDVRIVVCYI